MSFVMFAIGFSLGMAVASMLFITNHGETNEQDDE